MMAAQHSAPILAEDVRRDRRRTCLLLHPGQAAPGASDAERQMLLDRTQAINRAADYLPNFFCAVELPQLDVASGAGA